VLLERILMPSAYLKIYQLNCLKNRLNISLGECNHNECRLFSVDQDICEEHTIYDLPVHFRL